MHGVQLWQAAVKVLYAARVILPPSLNRKTDGSAVDTSQLAESPTPLGESFVIITTKSYKKYTPAITSFDRCTVSPSGRLSLLQDPTNGTNGTAMLRTPIEIEKHFERDMYSPKGLPTPLWVKIFVEYAEATDVLNEKQVDNIIRYATDRSNIGEERHAQVKGESHQIWHVLEQLDCFTYELKMAN
jgi:hypothetical protein